MKLQFDRGAHACHLFDSRDEHMGVAAGFLSDGLALGEYCAYVTADSGLDDWTLELQRYGLDVLEESARGAMEVLSGPAYRGVGDFNSIAKARELLRFMDSKRDDFRGLRIVGDVGWALETQLPVESLCHWEATANLVWEDANARAICQYDLRAHVPAALHSALRTHPIVVFEGRPRHNPFYEARAILAHEPHLNSSSAGAGEVEAMLERLRSF